MTDYVFDPTQLSPKQALTQLDEAERRSSELNRAADEAKQIKAKAKTTALQVLEIQELPAVAIDTDDGKRVTYSTYEFRAYRVVDTEAFNAWADVQDEAYYDPSPRLREAALRDECRRRVDDGEPLPPGVQEYTDQRISRSAQKR